MDVTVAVGTYGPDTWATLAQQRALPSVPADVPTIHHHASTLCEARNDALSMVETEWVCFLDADDELEAGYLDAMATGTADLRAPSVRYVRDPRRLRRPIMPKVSGHTHECVGQCLPYGNWLVIGTLAPTALLCELGGFREFPMYEDWDLWLRCWQAGATIEPIPDAVYRAHVRSGSRNRAPDRPTRLAVHRQIASANGVPVP